MVLYRKGMVIMMKKENLIIVFILLPLLTSCEVHAGGASYDLPWYIIAAAAALLTVICLIVSSCF